MAMVMLSLLGASLVFLWLWGRDATQKKYGNTRRNREMRAKYDAAVREIQVYTHDRATAESLLRSNFRGSIQWAKEKAIEDLIRDRR